MDWRKGETNTGTYIRVHRKLECGVRVVSIDMKSPYHPRSSAFICVLFPMKSTERGCSSDGRAPPLHGGGQGFESPHLHQRRLTEPANAGILVVGTLVGGTLVVGKLVIGKQ